MPLPTTRKGRWLFRKIRYAKRLKRLKNSYPRMEVFPGSYLCLAKRFGPWEFETDGRNQQSLNALLVNPTNSRSSWTYPGPVAISSVGFKRPPHVAAIPSFEDQLGYHTADCLIGFHNRPMRRLGHKLNRLDGVGRAIYYANLCDLFHRTLGRPGGFPPWDPLHRTPVIDDPDDWWPARHVRHCHGQPI